MSKRKREQGDEDGGQASSATRAPNFRRQRQVMAAFAQGAQQLEQALKLARGFERQKLGRRKKSAQGTRSGKGSGVEIRSGGSGGSDLIARIDAEVAALKTLDMARCAQHVLAKSLLRIKAVAAAPDLPAAISAPKAMSSEAAALNVYARLRNSNPVKAVLPGVTAAVKRELGIVDGGVRAQEEEQQAEKKKRRQQRGQGVYRSDGNENDNNDDDSDMSEQVKDVGHSEDSLGEDDSDLAVEDLERLLEREGAPPSRRRGTHESHSESDMEDRSPKLTAKAVPKKLFLPTLTMAGYVSGSGSEVDDDEDAKPKKNRRGQRARQAVWEKKYGKKAKHVQEQDAKQGWDAKRGAVSSSKFAKDANKLPLGKQRAMFSSNAGAAVSKKPQRDDSGPLHPSWEAAKRAKEKESVPVAFQGKKISFD